MRVTSHERCGITFPQALGCLFESLHMLRKKKPSKLYIIDLWAGNPVRTDGNVTIYMYNHPCRIQQKWQNAILFCERNQTRGNQWEIADQSKLSTFSLFALVLLDTRLVHTVIWIFLVTDVLVGTITSRVWSRFLPVALKVQALTIASCRPVFSEDKCDDNGMYGCGI